MSYARSRKIGKRLFVLWAEVETARVRWCGLRNLAGLLRARTPAGMNPAANALRGDAEQCVEAEDAKCQRGLAVCGCFCS